MRTIRDDDSGREETVEVDGVRVVRKTTNADGSTKALLLDVEGVEVWVPYWAVHDDSDVYDVDQAGTLTIVHRIAVEKGLVDE